jgi:glycosyltransferase 2 family protein
VADDFRIQVRAAQPSRQRLFLAVRLAVAVGGLAVLFRFVPLDALAETLAGIHAIWLGVALLMQYAMRAVATLRMKVIADHQGLHLSHFAHWRILLITQFYSMLLPGPVVGGGATWMKYVQHGADHPTAAASIVLNRAVGLVMLVVIGAMAWFADAGQTVPLLLATLLLAGLLALAVFDVRALPLRSGHGAHFRRAAAAGGPALPPASRRPQDGAQGSRPGIRSLAVRIATELLRRLELFVAIPRRGKLVVVTGSALYEVVAAATMLCFAMAVGLALPLLTVLWMRAALQLLLLLPFTIAGLGLREAGLVGLCALVGVPAAVAVAWSLTILLGQITVAASGGVLEAKGASGELRGGAQPSGTARRSVHSGAE